MNKQMVIGAGDVNMPVPNLFSINSLGHWHQGHSAQYLSEAAAMIRRDMENDKKQSEKALGQL